MTSRWTTRGIRYILWIAVAAVVPACSGDGKPKGSSTSRRSLGADAWVWQNPLPQGHHFWQVDFSDDDHGWAVGDSGAIVATDDGGNSWSLLPGATTNSLRGVDALASGTVWAVGKGGAILKSLAGGPFTRISSGTTQDLYAVRFINELKGWAAGDDVLISTADGGTTWTPVALSVSSNFFLTIVFVNDLTGWVSGEFNTFKTVDGGTTWSNIGPGFASLSFVDAMNGWAANGSRVARTTDGGATWTNQATFSMLALGVTSVSFSDLNNGWATGEVGIHHTADGGATWTQQATGGHGMEPRSVFDLGEGRAIIVGRYGLILRTVDHGRTWWESTTGHRANLQDLVTLDGRNAWVIGSWDEGPLLYTGDGGATWTRLSSPTRDGFTSLTAVWDPEACEVILWGTSGKSVYRSRDSGQTWTSQIVASEFGLWAVSFPDAQHGWVAGSYGMVFATADGGATWTEQSSGVTDGILVMKFADARTGWLVGGSRIMATTDGGTTWTQQISPFRVSFVWDMAVIDPVTVRLAGWFDAGAPGTGTPRLNYASTTDGGATWTAQRIGSLEHQSAYSLSFGTRDRGWILIDDYSIWTTADGGGTWTYQSTPTVSDPWKLRFADAQSGWLIGHAGIIMKTTTGGE
jgi:photosystem II stability/assembly factor-like uncharacterized protein